MMQGKGKDIQHVREQAVHVFSIFGHDDQRALG